MFDHANQIRAALTMSAAINAMGGSRRHGQELSHAAVTALYPSIAGDAAALALMSGPLACEDDAGSRHADDSAVDMWLDVAVNTSRLARFCLSLENTADDRVLAAAIRHFMTVEMLYCAPHNVTRSANLAEA